MSLAREQITGLVLAGGRGSRMGGLDKGLQIHQGVPLALHALRRLQPQVGRVMINANRHLAAYEALGVPVWPDTLPGFAGPLAGLLAGLEHCHTPWLLSVPCDAPNFPPDLALRLAAALAAAAADIAIAATREGSSLRVQPVFCLLKRELRDSLAASLQAGERRFSGWVRRHAFVEVPFEDAGAFFNANTLAELQTLQPDADNA
jgi:molybdopterin-guanine dinucleotide biosynthesis protein A